ncbi:DUF1365 domain-containing protein [Nisaea acidiphila]|uniref:DUF1365 domain-containing protein n=1 Tax=Nisaea acidiphila TaxID=1862145 RepID=A0A9J7ATV7_9PROT|nr:DUF1365 domain-containing protein [Nisaea acidiphila]UUX49756.1 DUF1365 domain-containing protein [Nisaea acidiphila]
MTDAAEQTSAVSCLYRGEVMHARLLPFRHRFVYRVFSMLVDLDELDTLASRLRFFSRNRFNLFSYFDRDHGTRDGAPVRDWVRDQLRTAGLESLEGRITTHCFPRILGFVFNPLTIYFCHHEDGRLQAILYEVKNTFGQQHCYLIPVEDRQDPAHAIRQSCEKGFYVSPFMEMQSTYRFRVKEPGEKLSILIRQETPEGETLVATHTGRREDLTDTAILKMAALYPLLTLKVVAGIHWEALKLWIKGAVFHERPAEPDHAVSVIGKSSAGQHAA